MMTLTRENKYKFIKFSYWLGAILDGIWCIIPFIYMFFSDLSIFTDLGYPSPISEFGYYALVGVVGLMFGWTLLLIWGVQKPIERKDTLLLTTLVCVILLILQIIGFINGNKYILPISLLSNLSVIFYGIGYVWARSLE